MKNNLLQFSQIDIDKIFEMYKQGNLTFRLDNVTNEYVLTDKQGNEIILSRDTYTNIVNRIEKGW